MAERHQQSPDDHGAAVAEHAVGQKSAEDRGEIDQRRIVAIDEPLAKLSGNFEWAAR
jgi:hypothetical protein